MCCVFKYHGRGAHRRLRTLRVCPDEADGRQQCRSLGGGCACHEATLSHARKWDPCPLSGLCLHLDFSTSPVFSPSREDANDGHLENAGGLRCGTWNTRGPIGSPTSHNLPGKENTHILNDLPRITISFLQAIQVLVPQFGLYGTCMPNNLNVGGSAICIHKGLLPDGAMVTHVAEATL